MSQAEFIRETYKKSTRNNTAWQFSDKPHSISIRLQNFDVDKDRMDFEPDDYPYLRVALLDKHLEETNAEKQPI